MTLPTLAAIDIGSNTIRLIVASPATNGYHRHLVQQRVTRLGAGLKPGESLSPKAMKETIEVLRNYRAKALALGARSIIAGATSAVREAKNGQDFMNRINMELGIKTVVLSEEKEAELTAAGVISGLAGISDEALIFDLGGRSTEFILTEKGDILTSVSLSMGAVTLTEAFLISDPPGSRQIQALKTEVRTALEQDLTIKLEKAEPKVLIGTAGTVTTLVAIVRKLTLYQPELVHNYCLTQKTLEELSGRLARMTTPERALIPGLPEDRADIIVAGAIVVLIIMNFLNKDKMIVSDTGLLEGLWLAAAGQRRIS